MRLPDALATVADWPVDTVATAVTDGSQTLAEQGPTDDVFAFASVTKLLSAYATLITIQDGVVHLDEPAGPDDAPEGITVRHLLAHASGLPLERDGAAPSAVERRRIYSNWGFELLGDLVAERVGMPFTEHLEVEVLNPLQMGDTKLEGSPAHAASGTVNDLLRFARELLNPTLLDADLLANAVTVEFAGLDGVVPGFGRQQPCDWGLGFELKGSKDPHWTGAKLPERTFGHFGQSGSFLWVDPTREVACAELASEPFGAWAKKLWPPFNDVVVDALDADATG